MIVAKCVTRVALSSGFVDRMNGAHGVVAMKAPGLETCKEGTHDLMAFGMD